MVRPCATRGRNDRIKKKTMRIMGLDGTGREKIYDIREVTKRRLYGRTDRAKRKDRAAIRRSVLPYIFISIIRKASPSFNGCLRFYIKLLFKSRESEVYLDTKTLDCTAGLTSLTEDVPPLVHVLDSPRQAPRHGTVPVRYLLGKSHQVVVLHPVFLSPSRLYYRSRPGPPSLPASLSLLDSLSLTDLICYLPRAVEPGRVWRRPAELSPCEGIELEGLRR